MTHLQVHDRIMESRLHQLYKSLMGRGVNVACGDDEGFESHFYLATDLSLLTRALWDEIDCWYWNIERWNSYG